VPQWLSRDMDMAEHAIVANGIVFTYASGEDTTQIVPDRAFDDPAGAQNGGAISNGGDSPHSRIAARGALRTRRADGPRVVEQRQRDRDVESLQRPDGGQRPRLHHDVRRHDLRLRHQAIGARDAHLDGTSLLAILCALAGTIGWAQGRNVGFDWPATGADAQRTAWLRLDPNISAANLSKPGFEFLWQEKLPNAPRQSASLSQGVTMNGLLGFTPASFVTGVSNNVFALDNDTGYPVWHRRFDDPLPAPTAACPGASPGRQDEWSASFVHLCNCRLLRHPSVDTVVASGWPAKACPWRSRDAMGARRCEACRLPFPRAAAAGVLVRADMKDRSTSCRAAARCTRSARSREWTSKNLRPFFRRMPATRI
jgi:hypothetical protein